MEKNNTNYSFVKNEINGKVLKIPFPSLVKDEDITNLFMGLVKLIQRNSEYKSERKYGGVIASLRKEINMLKLENKLLKENIGK